MQKLTPRQLAILTGISLLVMALIAGFSFGFVHSKLVIPDDTHQTFLNLNSQSGLFLGEITGWAAIMILDIIVAIALFRFFNGRNQAVNKAAATARLVYCLFLLWGIVHLVLASGLAGDTSASEAVQSQIMDHLLIFGEVWSWGLIIFGFHLIGLGLLFNSGAQIPRVFAYLLWIAGVSYIIVHSLKAFSATESLSHSLETILALPMMVGELGLAIWLLIKGGRNIQ